MAFEISLLVAIAFLAVAAVVAFRILEGVLKTVITGIAILSVVLGIGAFLVVMDANDLRENFAAEENLFLVTENGMVVAGVEVDGNATDILTDNELDAASALLKDGDSEALTKGYYKVVAIEREALGSGGEDDLLPAMEGLFSDPALLITQYKAGNVRVYEETPVFKVIKYLPDALIDETAGRLVGDEVEDDEA